MDFEELSVDNHAEARQLILTGLADHWGTIDESLNPDLNDMMSSYAGGRTVLVRDQSGTVVGTGTLIRRSSEIAEIVRMSVAKSSRRQGIGRRIVAELIATASRWQVKAVVLETSTTWSEVIDFYQRCGFTITGVEDGDFGSDTWFERLIEPPSTG